MKVVRLTLLPLLLLCSCEGAGFPVLGAPEVREEQVESPPSEAMGGSPSSIAPPTGGERERPEPPSLPAFDNWGQPVPLSFSTLESRDQDPFLRSDGRELYFSSLREGSKGKANIWAVTRDSVESDWGVPFPVETLNTDFGEATPEMSQDGLYLILARSDGSSYLLYESRRLSLDSPWSEPTLMTSLGGDARGISPGLSHDSLSLAFNRNGEALDVEVFVAHRSSPNEEFGEATPFTALNSPLDDWDIVYGDGLFVVLAQNQELVFAERSSFIEDFGPVIPLSTVNTEWREFDPWLSLDRKHMLFASDREGSDRIYEVHRD